MSDRLYQASVRSKNGSPVNPVNIFLSASSRSDAKTRLARLPWAEHAQSSVGDRVSKEQQEFLEETWEDTHFVGNRSVPAWCKNTQFYAYLDEICKKTSPYKKGNKI